jgi:hypothetical protein
VKSKSEDDIQTFFSFRLYVRVLPCTTKASAFSLRAEASRGAARIGKVFFRESFLVFDILDPGNLVFNKESE